MLEQEAPVDAQQKPWPIHTINKTRWCAWWWSIFC